MTGTERRKAELRVKALRGQYSFFHAIDTFTMRNKYLGDEWEEKKINEIMEKDKKKKAAKKKAKK